jgi:hypothetical protein
MRLARAAKGPRDLSSRPILTVDRARFRAHRRNKREAIPII